MGGYRLQSSDHRRRRARVAGGRTSRAAFQRGNGNRGDLVRLIIILGLVYLGRILSLVWDQKPLGPDDFFLLASLIIAGDFDLEAVGGR
jgi:hypothetical protein